MMMMIASRNQTRQRRVATDSEERARSSAAMAAQRRRGVPLPGLVFRRSTAFRTTTSALPSLLCPAFGADADVDLV